MKRIVAKKLRPGMVVVSSGELKMRVVANRIMSMTVVELTVVVLNSRRPKVPHMHGREVTFTIGAATPYRRVKKKS